MPKPKNKPQMRSDYPPQVRTQKPSRFSKSVLTIKDAYASIKAWYKNKTKGLTMKETTTTKKNNKSNSTTKAVVIAILITLGVVAAFAGTFYAGVKYSQAYNDKVEVRASQLVSDLKQ